MEHFIFDGYNLIYSNENLKNLLKNFPQEAREKLVSMVSDFIGKKKIRATIVFDGVEQIDETRHQSRTNIRVVYSFHDTADNEIKRLIDGAKNRKNLTIISSDNEIQRYAKINGAKFIRSTDFILRSKQSKFVEEKKSVVTKGEVDYWLKIYNEK